MTRARMAAVATPMAMMAGMERSRLDLGDLGGLAFFRSSVLDAGPCVEPD